MQNDERLFFGIMDNAPLLCNLAIASNSCQPTGLLFLVHFIMVCFMLRRRAFFATEHNMQVTRSIKFISNNVNYSSSFTRVKTFALAKYKTTIIILTRKIDKYASKTLLDSTHSSSTETHCRHKTYTGRKEAKCFLQIETSCSAIFCPMERIAIDYIHYLTKN